MATYNKVEAQKVKELRAAARRHILRQEKKGVVFDPNKRAEAFKKDTNITHEVYLQVKSRFADESGKKFSWQRFDDYARIGESVSEVYSQAWTPTKLSKPMTVMASKKGFSGATLNEDLQSMQGRLTKPEALKDLHDMLTKIAGEHAGEMPKAGMENEYFTIDKSWKGNQNDLWKYIEFADDIKLTGKLGKTVYQDILDMYTNNPYLKKDSTYENDWHWKSYVTNAEKIRDQAFFPFVLFLQILLVGAFVLADLVLIEFQDAGGDLADKIPVVGNEEHRAGVFLQHEEQRSDRDLPLRLRADLRGTG